MFRITLFSLLLVGSFSTNLFSMHFIRSFIEWQPLVFTYDRSGQQVLNNYKLYPQDEAILVEDQQGIESHPLYVGQPPQDSLRGYWPIRLFAQRSDIFSLGGIDWCAQGRVSSHTILLSLMNKEGDAKELRYCIQDTAHAMVIKKEPILLAAAALGSAFCLWHKLRAD